jgi:hypothetical protein
MLRLVDRAMKAFADLTVGTVIVLAHVAIADRHSSRRDRSHLGGAAAAKRIRA